MNTEDRKQHPLKGRKLYIPQMSFETASLVAAAFRSIGVDAMPSPDSDEQTLELANRYTTGEECLPQRVVLGNLLKVISAEGFKASKTAYLLPTSSGPCRFGQYAPLIQKILREMGHEDVLVFSPTSSDGYGGIAENAVEFMRLAWQTTVIADILRKLLLMFRPYERQAGTTDWIQKESLNLIAEILETSGVPLKIKTRQLVQTLHRIRKMFLDIDLAEPLGSRPCIGIMGEIFLRLNNFSNQNLIRELEKQGAEAWLANVTEWVWYTNVEQKRKLKESNKKYSKEMLIAKIRDFVQITDERKLWQPFKSILKNREEHRITEILKYSWPYLPYTKSHGEMTLNAGNVVAYYKSGCDGVIDISPFTCMNGIVSQVVYPKISEDYDHIPVRIFYFDGVPFDLQGDIEIFMEMVWSYRKRRLG